MRIPELDQIKTVIDEGLDPCLNEHVAHISEEGIEIIPEAWVTCGDEEIGRVAIDPKGDFDQTHRFFLLAMSHHSTEVWRAIAKRLADAG